MGRKVGGRPCSWSIASRAAAGMTSHCKNGGGGGWQCDERNVCVHTHMQNARVKMVLALHSPTISVRVRPGEMVLTRSLVVTVGGGGFECKRRECCTWGQGHWRVRGQRLQVLPLQPQARCCLCQGGATERPSTTRCCRRRLAVIIKSDTNDAARITTSTIFAPCRHPD